MALKLETFTNRAWRPGNNYGGNTMFKALGHPLSADKARVLMAEISARGSVAVYDPLAHAEDFDNFYNLAALDIEGVYVQQVEEEGRALFDKKAKLLSDLPTSKAKTVFVAAFNAERLIDNIAHLIPKGTEIKSFDDIALPDIMLSDTRTYLAPINFATNFGFLRDQGDHHTIISSANYWAGYGAENPELWLCLFDQDGTKLAEWTEPLPGANATYVLDSREIKKRFGLGDFTGSLFMHAIRIKGHDIVKYAVDTFGDDEAVLSCTHDANAWPADLYAGMPAPDGGEKVVLWLQNSHPVPVPKGGVGLNLVGSQDIAWLDEEIPPFATCALDVSTLLPNATWPAQIEVQAGRYFVRPRYEVTRADGKRRIAHANVERTDLKIDPKIPTLSRTMGKGYIMPLPVLPTDGFSTQALPTPMATCETDLPLKIILYDAKGYEIANKFLGNIPRPDSVVVDIDAWLGEEGKKLDTGFGHVEFLYDFQDGGGADGWLHALGRYEQRDTGHKAETIFGAHIYNTALVYNDEPQSYIGRPPGLSTRLFLRLGTFFDNADTMCHLIYPASLPWHEKSDTKLILHSGKGEPVAERTVHINCGGSLNWRYWDMFEGTERKKAGVGAYVLVRDVTCRLFGFHGIIRDGRAFSLDHMFGF